MILLAYRFIINHKYKTLGIAQINMGSPIMTVSYIILVHVAASLFKNKTENISL